MASQRLDRGDVTGANDQFQVAEKGLRAIWSGTIEDDAISSLKGEKRQWQAALMLALVHRGLGDVEHIEILRLSQQILASPKNSSESLALAPKMEERRRRKNANYGQALKLLDRLVAMQNFSPEALMNRAEVRQRMGDTAGSESDFNQWLGISQASLDSHFANRKRIEEAPGSANNRRDLLALWDEKIASAKEKQTGVLMRLGNMHYDLGLESQNEAGLLAGLNDVESSKKRAQAESHFGRSLRYLESAKVVAPDRLDTLIKLAQVEGHLGQYESALKSIENYIAKANLDPNTQWEKDLSRAYLMKAEYERHLGRQR
jgi:hypothetical protein